MSANANQLIPTNYFATKQRPVSISRKLYHRFPDDNVDPYPTTQCPSRHKRQQQRLYGECVWKKMWICLSKPQPQSPTEHTQRLWIDLSEWRPWAGSSPFDREWGTTNPFTTKTSDKTNISSSQNPGLKSPHCTMWKDWTTTSALRCLLVHARRNAAM